ncbi:response regulator transcription factor [Costertonia aggregata]|uniref:Response regulator transcription factor n=1 Tax=Costertonia aggregata TaxID=343403 RepID=A0A7H9AT78_9FLAO|nr:response regulator transcription factor [Costertonia aggregata]QLG46650.1 response regulator transcription factor [Costertonia aggregata]
MKPHIQKIIVIDNDPKFHEIYTYYFERYLDYSLEGIYTTISHALDDYDTIMPNIIVSDVSLEGTDGITSISHFRKKDWNAKIIMVSDQSDFEIIKKSFKNGAVGYLTKPLSERRLYEALNSIRYEGVSMSHDIIKKIVSTFSRKSYEMFSERENEIIDYLQMGATYKVMAEKLFVTTSTINFHMQNIYLKLNVNSKSEALIKLQEIDQELANCA